MDFVVFSGFWRALKVIPFIPWLPSVLEQKSGPFQEPGPLALIVVFSSEAASIQKSVIDLITLIFMSEMRRKW